MNSPPRQSAPRLGASKLPAHYWPIMVVSVWAVGMIAGLALQEFGVNFYIGAALGMGALVLRETWLQIRRERMDP